MSRVARRPLDRDAVRAADDDFYANHPELVQNGRRIPLSASDPAQADLRREWMDLYIAHGGEVEGEETGTGEGDREVDDPVQPCPHRRSLTGRFALTEAKCGDEVGLEADGQNIADGTSASFALRSPPGGATFRTETAPLNSNQVRGLNWVSKKPTDDWPRPEVDFRVTAGGETADSENQFNFHRYANQASETKTIPCSSGVYGWTGKFDIAFTDGVVIVTIKIKLINRLGSKPASGGAMPAAGPAVSDADKTSMRTDIEGKLSGKRVLHRDNCQRGAGCDCPNGRKCCKFQVQVRVRFVESGQHHEVNLFQGSGQASARNWTRVKTRDNSWAHETGHLLAWYDEYATGAVGSAPRWQPVRAGAVMNTGLTVPAEYYWDFRDWHQSKSGEPWELLSP